MSKEHAELLALPDSAQTEDAPPVRSRKQSADSVLARTRREAIALDGLMFESGSTADDSSLSPTAAEKQPEKTQLVSDRPQHVGHGRPDQAGPSEDDDGGLQQIITQDLQQNVASTSRNSSPSTSIGSTSSESSPGLLSVHQETRFEPEQENSLAPPSLARSVSRSKRQSLFMGDHITINQEGPIIVSPSSHSPNSNDDQEDMKEVQIETEDPSHLFWVPFHLHPEIAPNEYNKWLSKHGVDSGSADGAPSSRSPSVSRRKSVLSALYNPEEDKDEQPNKPAKIDEESQESDFLSGVFSVPLDQMGEPPLKTKTSLRRSVSLSATSPTRDHFPTDAEEDLVAVKRPGALERGGLSLLRRSARTKIRRNSTASNDTRNDVSRLRQTISATGEYPAVSLVDNGPLPRPSTAEQPVAADITGQDTVQPRKEGDSAPLKRFVSTLRDPSKPTITTYVEPHLLEQQRKENNEANGDRQEDEEAPSFRISAPGNLENSAAARSLAETFEHDRKENLDNLALNYPIPPPVKLAQNLLQEPGSQSASPSKTAPPSPASHQQAKQKQSGQQHSNISHSKKPSTWSWLWGKERAGEKGTEPSPSGSSSGAPAAGKPNSPPTSQSQSPDGTSPTVSPNESTSKKPSTLSLLFSRNGKSASSKSQSTTAENAHSSAMGGAHGLSSSSSKPKYSNYNRLPIHIERAIYRLSHVKLANPRRPLHEQVLISNMMFWYLGVIQQQQMLQQQADLRQQEQLQQQQVALQQKHGRSGSPDSFKDDSKEDKDSKSKQKPKKRKSQKKKNRGPSKSAERIVKSPEYELQQQFHVDQAAAHSGRPRQQGSSLPSTKGSPQNAGRSGGDLGPHSNGGLTEHDEESKRVGGVASYSDSYESDGDDSQLRHELQQDDQRIGSQSGTLTGLSIKAAPKSQREEDEEDDDVPLGHYQSLPRQAVPVS